MALEVDEDTAQALTALMLNFRTIGEMFRSDEGTPEGLRMVVASMRESMAILERLADEWERSWRMETRGDG